MGMAKHDRERPACKSDRLSFRLASTSPHLRIQEAAGLPPGRDDAHRFPRQYGGHPDHPRPDRVAEVSAGQRAHDIATSRISRYQAQGSWRSFFGQPARRDGQPVDARGRDSLVSLERVNLRGSCHFTRSRSIASRAANPILGKTPQLEPRGPRCQVTGKSFRSKFWPGKSHALSRFESCR
jgi:hypothetical protein